MLNFEAFRSVFGSLSFLELIAIVILFTDVKNLQKEVKRLREDIIKNRTN